MLGSYFYQMSVTKNDIKVNHFSLQITEILSYSKRHKKLTISYVVYYSF